MWMVPHGMFYPAKLVSKNFDFRRPAAQPLPTNAADLAALMTNLGEPDSIHLLDESSGPALDYVGSNDLTYGAGIRRRQRSIGLPSGQSLIDKRCAETSPEGSANNAISAADTDVFDPGENDFAHLLVFRMAQLPDNPRALFAYRNTGGFANGWEVFGQNSGNLTFRVDDGTTQTSDALNTIVPGSWMAIIIGRAGGNTFFYSTKLANGQTSTAPSGSLSQTDNVFALGTSPTASMGHVQFAYHATWQNLNGVTASEAQTDLNNFWTLHSDPTGHLDTATHNGSITCLVGSGTNFGECWYDYSGDGTHGRDQIPLDYSLDDGQLGLYCNRTISTTVLESEDLSTWNTVGATSTANAIDSPRGFREAIHIDQTSGVGYITSSGTGNPSTEYRCMVALRTPDAGHNVRVVIRNQDDTVTRAAEDFPITDQWTVVGLNFSTAVGQDHFHIRIFGGDNGTTGESYAWRPTVVSRSSLAATTAGVYNVLISSNTTQSQTFWRVSDSAGGGSGIEEWFDPRKGEVLVDLRPYPPDAWSGGLRIWEARRGDAADNNFYAGHSNALETPRYVIEDDGGNSIVATNSDQAALTNAPYTWRWVWDHEKNIPGVNGTAQIFVDDVQQFDTPPTTTWSTSGDDMTTHRFGIGTSATGGSQFPCSIRRVKVFKYLSPAFLPLPENLSLEVSSGSSQAAFITDTNQNGVLDLTGSFTIEAWVQWNSVSGSQVITSKFGTSGNQSYACYLAQSGGSQMRFRIKDSGGNEDFVQWTFTPATDGTWYHVAFVFDSTIADTNAGRMKFIFNGTDQGTPFTNENSEVLPVDGDADFAIGAWDLFGTIQDFFDGRIDEVRVWDVARTATQIDDNKDAELNGNETNLVGYWKFNDDFTDATSNENDLTGLNNPTFSSDTPF